MARAEAAGACTRPDPIKGLAQSIARPAYRRLLTAEPALRRAVPALIIAFLVSVGIGAVIQAFAHRSQTIVDVAQEIELIAEIINDRLDEAAATSKSDVTLAVQRAMERGLPRQATAGAGWLVVTDASDVVVATSASAGATMGQRLADIIGRTQLITTLGTREVRETNLVDGTAALATLRTLKAPLGHLAIIHPLGDVLTRWR